MAPYNPVKTKWCILHNSNIGIDDLIAVFIADTPLIDVRAPVEFVQGSLPGSVNLPILDDQERARVGTTYKQQGSEAAVRLGYAMISGALKQDRLQQWLDFVRNNPHTVLYCFRGGKRSKITQQWLREAGADRPLITGGYKMARRFLIDAIDRFSDSHTLLIVTGPTGSGKTRLIQKMGNRYPVLDIEAIAQHRGSAFGGLPIPQPTQIDFENRLAVNLLKLHHADRPGPIVVEDESRHIGKVYLPASFFAHMRNSEVIWIDEPFATRVNNIFQDYILDSAIGHAQQTRQISQQAASNTVDAEILYHQALQLFEKYRHALTMISRKLGGQRYQEISVDLEHAQAEWVHRNDVQSSRVWIEKLVKYYYDPLYLDSLQRRQVKPCFRGSGQEVVDYMQSRNPLH